MQSRRIVQRGRCLNQSYPQSSGGRLSSQLIRLGLTGLGMGLPCPADRSGGQECARSVGGRKGLCAGVGEWVGGSVGPTVVDSGAEGQRVVKRTPGLRSDSPAPVATSRDPGAPHRRGWPGKGGWGHRWPLRSGRWIEGWGERGRARPRSERPWARRPIAASGGIAVPDPAGGWPASGSLGRGSAGYFRNHQVSGAAEWVMGPSIRMGLAAMAVTSFPFPVSRRLPTGEYAESPMSAVRRRRT